MNSYSISNAPASFQVHDKSHTVSVSSITQKMTKGGKRRFRPPKKDGRKSVKNKKKSNKKTTMSKEAQQRQQCMGERQQKALRNIGS